MKKIILSIVILVSLIVFIGESRAIYSVGEDKHVTIWKTFGGTCFVIPGKYYGLLKPSSHSYIKTTNSSSLDIIWPDNPNKIIVDINHEHCEIYNVSNGVSIIRYSSQESDFNERFTKFDGKFHRYKKGVLYINVSIADNIGIDASGKKL